MGTLWDVSNRGYGWASSVTDTYTHFLYFTYGGIDPNGDSGRAYGRPLRCLQE
ncbi:MAG: hypothetical protein K2K83_01740 [Rikenella sp.]|nr:hypothetical protein [Rikenella sp.]